MHSEVCLCFACCSPASSMNMHNAAVRTRLIGSQHHLRVLNDNGLPTSQTTLISFLFLSTHYNIYAAASSNSCIQILLHFLCVVSQARTHAAFYSSLSAWLIKKGRDEEFGCRAPCRIWRENRKQYGAICMQVQCQSQRARAVCTNTKDRLLCLRRSSYCS